MLSKITHHLLILIGLCYAQYSNAQSSQWSASNKFKNCMSSMQSTNDEQTRFNYAMNYFLTEHSTTIQLQDACHFLYSDQKKYELCLAAYPNVLDKDHFFDVYNTFSTFSYAIKLYHNTQEKAQISQIQNDYQLNVVKDNDEIYSLLIQKGDLLLSNNQFNEAILIYQQAAEIKPGDQEAINKINEVTVIQQQLAAAEAAENELNNQFNSFIQQGDVLLSSNQIKEAIVMYENAMALKPSDPIAYQRIKEANNWQSQMNTIADSENQKRTEYDFLIQKGDIYLSSNKYDEAIAVFQQASAIYPEEQLPYLKLDEATQRKLAAANANSICSTDENTFKQIKKRIKDETFSDDMFDMAKKQINKKCFTIEQLKEIVKLFSMDDDKLEMIKYVYDFSYETDRFYEFSSILTFSSTKKELDAFLVGK